MSEPRMPQVGDVISCREFRKSSGEPDSFSSFKVKHDGQCRFQEPTAAFVVERTSFDGGGTGHGRHDVYPDGHHVWVRMLGDDGAYDPNGDSISFYTSGDFTGQIDPKAIDYHGIMQMRFE